MEKRVRSSVRKLPAA